MVQIFVVYVLVCLLVFVIARTLSQEKRFDFLHTSLPAFVLTAVFYYVAVTHWETLFEFGASFDVVSQFFTENDLGVSIATASLPLVALLSGIIEGVAGTFRFVLVPLMYDANLLPFELFVVVLLALVLFGKRSVRWVFLTVKQGRQVLAGMLRRKSLV